MTDIRSNTVKFQQHSTQSNFKNSMEMPRRISRQAQDSLSFFRSDWTRSSQSEKSSNLCENGYIVGDETSLDLSNETNHQ